MAPRTGRSGVSGVIDAIKVIIRLTKLPRFWAVMSELFGAEICTALQLLINVAEALMSLDDQWYKIDIEAPAGPEDAVPSLAALSASRIDLDALYAAAKALRGA